MSLGTTLTAVVIRMQAGAHSRFSRQQAPPGAVLPNPPPGLWYQKPVEVSRLKVTLRVSVQAFRGYIALW